jgi:hypothetical protein
MRTRSKQHAALPRYLPQATYPTRVRRKGVCFFGHMERRFPLTGHLPHQGSAQL